MRGVGGLRIVRCAFVWVSLAPLAVRILGRASLNVAAALQLHINAAAAEPINPDPPTPPCLVLGI
jgi:hypothetical protein